MKTNLLSSKINTHLAKVCPGAKIENTTDAGASAYSLKSQTPKESNPLAISSLVWFDNFLDQCVDRGVIFTEIDCLHDAWLEYFFGFVVTPVIKTNGKPRHTLP